MTLPPTELRYRRDDRVLDIVFADGARYSLSAEYLRVQSPSAEVQGHSPEQRRIVFGRRAVGISGIEPVGNYGVQLIFDDRHDTGIYSWEYLRTLCAEHDTRWAAYLSELAARGLSRDPVRARTQVRRH